MLAEVRTDLQAVLERDPACRSRLEAWLCYPGFHALVGYRVAHALRRIRLHLLARLLSQFVRWLTGVEIHPAARIGRGVFIDHGMGVVIGETAEIGDDVTLYQGVTLGGTGKERGKRHPTIGRGVMVGVGAKILGNIVVGDNCKIGAGTVLIHSVPPNCTVVGIPGRVVRREGRRVTPASHDLEHADLPDPLEDQLEAVARRCADLERQVADLQRRLAARRDRCPL
jgi:serine O-acetyltransferase